MRPGGSFGDAPRSQRAGLILSWMMLGLALITLFIGEREAEPDVETATGSRETVVAVKDLEDRVADKLGGWDVPAAGSNRPFRVVASRVQWRDRAGNRWLTIDRISSSVRAGALTGGAIVLEDVDVAQPVVRLRQDASGGWNVAGIMRSRGSNGEDDDRDDAPGGGVELRNVRVRGGELALDMPGRGFEARRVSAVMPVARFGGGAPDPYIRLASLDGAVTGAVPGPAQALSLRDATLGGRPDGIEFAVGRLALDRTVVADVEGVLSDRLPEPGLRARGHAPNVEFADIHRLLPEFPESGTAAFDFALEPVGAGRTAVRLSALDVRSEGSQLAGMTTIVLGGETIELGEVDVRFDPLELAFLEQFTGPLPYSGTLVGSLTGSGERLRFDVAANLRAEGITEPIITRATGELALRGFTPDIRNVTATVDSLPLAALRAFVPGLPLRGVVSGIVSFAGMPGDGPLAIDATIGLPQGTIELDGNVRLGAVPSYDLTGSLVGVRVRELLEPDFPPVLLDARFTLRGTGTDPATADASLDLNGRFSGWQAGPTDVVVVDATLRDGTLRIARGVVALATLDASVTGDWRLVEPSSGALEYSVQVASLEPFGPYLPGPADQGTGSFSAEGTISGSLDRIAFTSALTGSDVAWGEYGARTLAGTIEYAATDSLPHLAVDMEAAGVTTSFGEYESATIDITLDDQNFIGEIVARRPGGGDLELAADGRVGGPGDSDLIVRRAIVDLGEERWALTQPAAIEMRPGGVVFVDELALAQTDGPGSLLVSGRVLPLDSAEFRYDIQALPVGEIQRLLGRDPVLTGRLWAAGNIETFGEPELLTEFRIEDAVAGGVPILRLAGTTRYSDGSLRLVASGALSDTAGVIDADITFPLRLALADSLQLGVDEAGAIGGRIRVDRFPVALISTFTDAVTEPVGSVSGTVELGGTIEVPSLNGSLALNRVALTIPALDQRFESVEGRVDFNGRRAQLVDVVARAGGTAHVSGSILFEELDDPVLDVLASLDAFEVMGADDDDPAEVSGDVTLRGLLSAPTVGGRISIDNGTIDIPTGGTADPFEEAELALINQGTFEIGELPGATPPAFGNVTIAGLVVDIQEDVWLATEQARARLAGELTVFHDAGGTRVFGNLTGNRGTFTLRAGAITRIFEIQEASIRFFGTGDLNPAIDITAVRTMGALEEPIELVVHVTGTLEHPSVQLATGDGTPVPESELLSVLVFGRPSFTGATQGGENVVGSLLAFGGITDLASARLQEALAEDAGLPIDYVQLRTTEDAGLSTDLLQNLSIALGTELYWDEVFLTVELPPARIGEYFAAAVQWRIDREWTLQLELEPIIRRGALDRIGLDEILGTDTVRRQFLLEIRRRWTY
ncbi:MAG TPA: translocation/assembly module TamB domain-containing protein [Longimicrobiales bacterium]